MTAADTVNPSVPPLIQVAIGILRGPQGILIARRPDQAVMGGLWEFPGGKIEADETPAQALVREFEEELGLAVVVDQPLPEIEHTYAHGRIRLRPYGCRLPPGVTQSPEPRLVAEYRWVSPQALTQYRFPEANRPLIDVLVHDRESG